MLSKNPRQPRERGELIYDESNIEDWRKEIKKIKTIHNIGPYVLIIMGLTLFSLVFYDFSIQEGIEWIILFLGIPFALGLGLYGLADASRVGYLKIYEKGIKLPFYKSFKDARANNEYFIPFKDITEVYLNTKHNLSDVVFVGEELEEDGVIHLEKQYIYDFNKFVETIEDKVMIVEDRDWGCDRCKD